MHAAAKTAFLLEDLRSRVARIERADKARTPANVLPFGLPVIDQHLPGGGLAMGALHEVASAGPDTEHGAAATLMLGGLVARLSGPVLWVSGQQDLFAPALALVGLQPDRLLIVEAGKDVLLAMEEGLRHAGLGAVVGEIGGRLTLTASRRLQLAAEQSGVTAFALRRSRTHDDPLFREPTAAATRWVVRSVPSPPPLADAPEVTGLGPQRWRLDLTRCRGGEPFSWTVEACDAQGHLRLSPDLAHRPLAPQQGRRIAAA